ncbi:MAG: hypothetical protein ACRCVV_09985 [Shewanella sp.]
MSTKVCAKVVKRVWLEGNDRISAAVFQHHLTEQSWLRANKNDESEEFVNFHDSTKVTFFFGGDLIVIHSNDFIPVVDSYEDFVKKLKVIQNSAEDAMERLKAKDKETYYFNIKRFLNESEGASSIYTSTIAITSSSTHGRTFEISDCDRKSRIYLGGRRPALKFLNRFNDFIIFCVGEVEKTLAKHGDTLRDYKDKIKF